MSEWEAVQLADLLTRVRRREPVVVDRLYPAASVLKEGQGLGIKEPFVGGKTTYKDLFRVASEDVIVRTITAFESPVAVASDQHDGSFVSQVFLTYIVDSRRASPSFLRLAFQVPSFWEEMSNRAKGTVMRRKTISNEAFLGIPLRLPPLPVQRQIVDLVGAVDANLKALDEEVRLACEATDAIRRLLFSDDEDTLPLDQVAEVTNGRQRSPKHASGDHMLRYIRAANVKDGELVLDEPQFMNFTPAEQKNYSLSPGDVLVTEGCGSLGQIGASCQWAGEIAGTVCFQNHLLRLRPLRQDTSADLLYQWARWAFRERRFASVATGTSIFSLGVGRVRAMPMAKAALERVDLVEVAVRADQAADARRAEVRSLRQLRKSLLGSLLSAEVEVTASHNDALAEAT